MNENDPNNGTEAVAAHQESPTTVRTEPIRSIPQPSQPTQTVPQAAMNKSIEEVIQAAFQVNQTVLTKDDPMTAVLVIQMQRFDQALRTLQLRDFRRQRVFIDKFKTEADKILGAVDKTERLRKEMMIELLTAHQSAVDEAEKCIYNGILTRWERDIRSVAEEQKLVAIQVKFLTLTVTLVVILQLILLVAM